MNRAYRILAFNARWVSMLVLSVVLVYAVSGRIATLVLPDYKADLEHYLSQQSGYDVRIAALKGRWIGFDPVLSIENISLNGFENARVGTASVRIAILRSLLSRSLRFNAIYIDDSHLSFEQMPDGQWQIAGLELSAGTSPEPDTSLLALLDEASISLTETNLTLKSSGGKLVDWRLPSVAINYRGDELFASGQVMQPGGLQTLLSFSLHGLGVLSPTTLNGTMYLEARSTEFFDELLKVYEWENMSVQNIDASGRAWLDFKGLGIERIQADLQMREMNWKVAEKSLPPFQNVAGQFVWQKNEQQNRLSIHHLSMSWGERDCKPVNVSIDFGAKQATSIYADVLDAECIGSLAVATGMASPDLEARLEVSEPKGFLRHANIDIPGTGNTPDFKFEAELHNVSISAYDGTPSGEGISGYIFADGEGGEVLFRSRHFALGFPELFLDPWEMALAEGSVSWSLQGEDVTVFSNGLRLYMSDDSAVFGDFELRLNPDDQEDYLSLAIAVQDIPFERVPDFVPFYAVGKDLHDWLGESLVAGSVTEGVYYGYGSTEDWSGDNSFTSSFYMKARDGELKYDREWPHLEQLSANIFMQNEALLIEADEAQIHGTPLQGLTGVMPKEQQGQGQTLLLSAKVNAGPPELTYWMKESPIADNTRAIAEQIELRGSVMVDLQVSVPMLAGEDIGYKVTAGLNGIDVYHLPSELLFEQVKGALVVDSERGLVAKKISSRLFGEQSSLDIHSRSLTTAQPAPRESSHFAQWTNQMQAKANKQEKVQEHHLVLRGGAPVNALLKHFNVDEVKGLSGRLPYRVELVLPENDTDPYLTLKSDMKGVARNWPQPYGKSVDQREQLDARVLIKPDQLFVDLKLSSENAPEVDGEFLFIDKEFSFGQLLLGGVKPTKTHAKGLGVVGTFDVLELEPWLSYFDIGSDKSAGLEASLLESLELSAANLLVSEQSFRNVHARVAQVGDAWDVQLGGDDIAGVLRFPNGNAPINVDLKHLNLTLSETDTEQAKDEEIDPRRFPELGFKTDMLRINAEPYGAWSSRLEPVDQGVIFRDVKGQIGKTRIDGQLNWQQREAGANTLLTLDLVGEDVEQLLSTFGWGGAITSSNFKSSLALVWPSKPQDFDLAMLSGKVDISMNDGFLKTSDQKTGALRLLGIFNAEAIGRRLKLDFSDLYKSGVGYDTLSVGAVIDQGRLSLKTPLLIEGPSSKYKIEGEADLAKKTLNMKMNVEFPLAQNVPLAALLLGAPQVGGAVWLVDKLLGEPLSQITSARFNITGPWAEPKIEQGKPVKAK